MRKTINKNSIFVNPAIPPATPNVDKGGFEYDIREVSHKAKGDMIFIPEGGM